MSHPLRKWIKNTLQYGRRSAADPTDGKPPLLWLADLPRLTMMWGDYLLYRARKDLRETPPRVVFAPREIFSPHVQMIRPTQLRPIEPLVNLRAAWNAIDKWLTDGGLERVIGQAGQTLTAGIASLFTGIIVAAAGVVGGTVAAIAGLFGLTFLGSTLGLQRLGEATDKLLQDARASMGRFGDELAETFSVFTRLRRPKEMLWAFGATSGSAGLFLLIFLYHWPAAETQVLAAETPTRPHVVQRPPETTKPAAEITGDPFGGLPDPFGNPTPPPEPLPDFGADPFGAPPGDLLIPVGIEEPVPTPLPDPIPAPMADVLFELERGPLPAGVLAFNLPDDQTPVRATLAAAVPPRIDLSQLAGDRWELSLSKDVVTASPPATYRPLNPPQAVSRPSTNAIADRFVPALRNIAVSIQKSQPAQTVAGALVWYELIVKNDSADAIGGLTVEEHVAAPHRIANAEPAAKITENPAAGSTLVWELAGLPPHGETRLRVAVYPLSGDPIESRSAVRPVSSFSAVTMVEQPVRPEPPIAKPEPVLVDEPTITVMQRIKLVMTTPDSVTRGTDFAVRFRVKNTGDLPLSNVVLRGNVPRVLRHRDGAAVETSLGTLNPSEEKTVELQLTAAEFGEAAVLAEVSAAEGITTAVRGAFDVVDPLSRRADCNCGDNDLADSRAGSRR